VLRLRAALMDAACSTWAAAMRSISGPRHSDSANHQATGGYRLRPGMD
jgi:hypothetical protein